MDARELEALSMLSRGFLELKDVNPELGYNIILDILSGINEYDVSHFFGIKGTNMPHPATLLYDSIFRHPVTSFLISG